MNTRAWACPSTASYPAYLLIECAGRAGSAGLLVDELADVLGDCPQVEATAVAVDTASRDASLGLPRPTHRSDQRSGDPPQA